MSKSRGIRRTLCVVLLVALAATGCNARALRGFGDSILAAPGNFVPPPPGQSWHGDQIKARINKVPTSDPTSPVFVAGWASEPGRTLTTHTMRSALDAFGGFAFDQPFNVALYSFGTNDAALYAQGAAGTYSSAIAKVHAEYWIQRSVEAGASCVIWVLGRETNPAFGQTTRATIYASYMRDLNGYLRNIAGNRTHAGRSYLFRTVDWNAMTANSANTMPDGQHPSAQGAIALGDAIHARAKGCPSIG